MSFTIDKQTLEELNLLGKYRQGSVYHLFNRVKTRGAEKLLDEMFHQPLMDDQVINKRSEVFKYFQQSALSFPFDVLQINLMREYLDSGAKTNYLLALADVGVKKLLSIVAKDERYRKIVQGLHATIVTLQKCQIFIGAIVNIGEGGGGVFADRLRIVQRIFERRELEDLLHIDIYQGLSLKRIAQYEHLLKITLDTELRDVLLFIYELDLNIAVSNIARERGLTYARALPPERNILSAIDLSHPCLDGAVGNAIEFSDDKNVIFLTGANMAGKSTLMKSIGILMYLAHMGFPIAAREVQFSVREGMYTSINVADNIGLGYSHFYAEVVRVKHAAEAAASGKSLLLMFDELFKGTNVKDAYDGTLAVTEAFAEYKNCMFVVSTHIIEVGEALQSSRNIQFRYMPTVMDGNRPRYTYKLKVGITEDRQGMMIIQNEGILELLK